jgi:hypothetical protein
MKKTLLPGSKPSGSIIDGIAKSPSAGLRFTFIVAAYLVSEPHSSGFARLASGSFYFAIPISTFYEIIIIIP